MSKKSKKPAKKRANNKRTEGVYIAKVIARLEEMGYVAARVDRYNAFSRRSHDLFGFADVIALPADNELTRHRGVMLVQVTSVENKAARIAKIKENETYHKLKNTCEVVVATPRKTQGIWVIQWHDPEAYGEG